MRFRPSTYATRRLSKAFCDIVDNGGCLVYFERRFKQISFLIRCGEVSNEK